MAEVVGVISSLDVVRARLRDDVTRCIFDYYASLLTKDGVPRHVDLKPEGMVPALPYMAIMDCADPAMPRYRLAGTAYAEYFGTNPTGRNYLEFVPEYRHPTVIESFTICVRQPSGMLMEILGISNTGQERITETIGFPVADDESGAPRFLYFTSVALETGGWNYDPTVFTKRLEVRERIFFSVGFGCPKSFRGVEIGPI